MAEEIEVGKENITDSVESIDSTGSVVSNTEELTDSEKLTIVEENTKTNLDKLEQEIKLGYRLVEYKDEKFRICFPSMKDDEKLARYKSKIAMETLKDRSVILKDEVVENLKERGLWNDQKEKQEADLREKYSTILSQYYLEKNKKRPDKATLAQLNIERNIVLTMLNALTKTKEYFTNLAAESRIDELVLKYKMTLCIKRDDTGECVWKSLEDLDNCEDKLLVNTIISDAIYFWAGLDQSMFDPAPGE